jgi:phytoene/squalene synthetase
LTESHLNEFARQGFLSRSGPGDAFRDLVQETAFRARCLYAEADKGIPELVTPMGRSCVRLMRAIYSEILAELEKQGWDPFLGRARTTLGRKLQVGAKAVILPEWS